MNWRRYNSEVYSGICHLPREQPNLEIYIIEMQRGCESLSTSGWETLQTFPSLLTIRTFTNSDMQGIIQYLQNLL